MTITTNKLLFVVAIAFAGDALGQPSITEDRMYLHISSDIVKSEQDIYLPNLSAGEPVHFIRWVYEYRNGLLISETALSAPDWTRIDAKKIFEYDEEGRIVKDSTYHPSLPRLNSQTTYEYNSKGQLLKAVEVNATTNEVYRLDTYSKYTTTTSYQKASQFFGDDNKKTIKYVSVYENGFKQQVIYAKQFAPINYQYDAAGRLVAKDGKKYFYKIDDRGNAVATVQIQYGIRIYNFFRNTYADGTITGSLEPDKDFIQEWDNQK
jgi:hypothetical protein